MYSKHVQGAKHHAVSSTEIILQLEEMHKIILPDLQIRKLRHRQLHGLPKVPELVRCKQDLNPDSGA